MVVPPSVRQGWLIFSPVVCRRCAEVISRFRLLLRKIVCSGASNSAHFSARFLIKNDAGLNS